MSVDPVLQSLCSGWNKGASTANKAFCILADKILYRLLQKSMRPAFAVEERYSIISGGEVKLNDILLPPATCTAEVPFSKTLDLQLFK